jgi:periplasmic protein TonB
MTKPVTISNNGDSGAPLALEDKFHRWNLPGIRIEMHEDAISRIGYDLGRKTAAQDDLAGLLLGKVSRLDPRTVTVMSVEPCASTELHSFLMNCGFVLGFYRIVANEELAFTDLDRNLVRGRFAGREGVFLLIKPSPPGPARGGFFFSNDSGLVSERSDFPVVERKAGEIPYVWEERIPNVPRPIAKVDPEPPTENVVSWKQEVRVRLRGLASATAGQALSLKAIPRIRREKVQEVPEPPPEASGWRRLAKPPILALTSAIAATLIAAALIWPGRAPDRLHLGATVVTGGVRLNWSKGGPVALANEGVLIIHDGDQQQELALSKKQLLEDTIVYVPASQNVNFTLQVVAGGVVHRDSISVYTPRPSPREPVASASIPTNVPELPPISVESATTPASRPTTPASSPTKPASRPETIVRALPRAEVKHLAPPEQAAAKPPDSRPPVSPTISTPPPAAEPTPVQVALSTPPAPISPPLAKEQPVPEPQAVVPKQERAQDSVGQVAPPRPIPIVEPAAPTPRASPPVEKPTPPQPLKQVKPVVPRSLKALITRDITMEVNLSIDADGKITKAEASTGGGLLQNSLGKLAVEAARLWKFQPARLGNRNVPGEVRIQFQFSP